MRSTAIGLGLLANLLYLLVLTGGAGYHLKTPAEFGLPVHSILISLVVAACVVPPLLGWGLLELLERHVPRRATVIWTVLAGVMLVGDLPYGGAGVTVADRVLLGLMHLIVGAAVIPAFVITSQRRS
ncbi:DUF6069 family protein [Streptacidiphilus neutrinimicus]|uniref:DUF6069 family protein n=1 Tax=Streptacidiphilus neutrinimicus TaxID=105420 RepID=UPI0006935030